MKSTVTNKDTSFKKFVIACIVLLCMIFVVSKGYRLYQNSRVNYEYTQDFNAYDEVRANCVATLDVYVWENETEFYALRDTLYESAVTANFINKVMGNTRVIPSTKYDNARIEVKKFYVDDTSNIKKARVEFNICSGSVDVREERIVEFDIRNNKVDNMYLISSISK